MQGVVFTPSKDYKNFLAFWKLFFASQKWGCLAMFGWKPDLYFKNNMLAGYTIWFMCATAALQESIKIMGILYKSRLQLTSLIPVSYWHEMQDIFFFKAVNHLIYIDNGALPTIKHLVRLTRSSSMNAVTYIPKRCRNVTYQQSFLVSSARIWNVLPKDFRRNNVTQKKWMPSNASSQYTTTMLLHSLIRTIWEPGGQYALNAMQQKAFFASHLNAVSGTSLKTICIMCVYLAIPFYYASFYNFLTLVGPL